MTKTEKKAYAYAEGVDAGIEAARNTDYDPDRDESMEQAARESEENARQYESFRFPQWVAENSVDEFDAEELWDRYETGVEEGIRSVIRGRKKSGGGE